MNEGFIYEMVHPYGWHSEAPVTETMMTITLSGKPYSDEIKLRQPFSEGQERLVKDLGPLTKLQETEILSYYKEIFN
jgi:hypothetical protein